MKRLLYFCLGLIIISSGLKAQHFSKAVVTDVVFVRQTNSKVNSLTFPFYFQEKGFIADVLGDIEKYLKQKFLVDSVEFSFPDSINYYSNFYPQDIKLKSKAKNKGGKDVLYTSVKTTVQQAAVINGTQLYKFITELTVYTGRGRLYYKFKNSIPFETFAGEDISGNIQMSDYDFYVFYFDGIQKAFEGIIKRDERRYVARPLTEKYADFAGHAEKFYMNLSGGSYNYGNDFENLVEVLDLKNNNLLAGSGYFNFPMVFQSEMISDGIFLANKLNDKKYVVSLGEGNKYVNAYANSSTPILVYFLNQNTDTATMFSYDRKDTLTAFIDSMHYKLALNENLNCYELFCNDSLIAAINEMEDRKVILVSDYITENQLGEMFNILFAFDYAMAVEDRLYDIYFRNTMSY
jgi:hypothetical protein